MRSRFVAVVLVLAIFLALALACGKSKREAECEKVSALAEESAAVVEPPGEARERRIDEALRSVDALCDARRATWLHESVARLRDQAKAREDKQREDERAKEHEREEMWRLRKPIVRTNLEDAKRLAKRSASWTVHLHAARTTLDSFAKTPIAATKEWTELDAIQRDTQKELDLAPRPKIDAGPAPDPLALRAKYKCRTGAMVTYVSSFDPCIGAALELCDTDGDVDAMLVDLGALGCSRVRTEKQMTEVCCPRLP